MVALAKSSQQRCDYHQEFCTSLGLRLYPRAAAALLRTILRKAQNQRRLKVRFTVSPAADSGERKSGYRSRDVD